MEICVKKEINTVDRSSSNSNTSVYLVAFSNGCIKPERCHKLKFTEYKHIIGKGEKETNQRILIASSNRLQYAGTTLGCLQSQKAAFCKYQIAVWSKKTNELKLYKAKLVKLTPIIENAVDDSGDTSMETYSQKRDMLNEAFGTKRKKKAIKSRMKYATVGGMESDAAIKAIEKAVIADAPKDNASATSSQMEEILPVKNKEACSAREVYDLYQVFPKDEYFALRDEAKILREATASQIMEWKTNNKYCNYVIYHLQQLNSITDHNARLLCYFNYLVILLKLNYQDFKKKDLLPNIPESAFKQKLMNRFIIIENENGKQQRSMPPKMKDKLMAYALVVALNIDNFIVQVSSFQQDFRTPMQKISRLAYALGCHVSSKTQGGVTRQLIELKLPLFVPSDRPFKGRKKT